MITAPSRVTVRLATRADLPRIGRLGALLVDPEYRGRGVGGLLLESALAALAARGAP